MRILSVTLAVSGVTSIGALAILVAADRQLGVPVPYALSVVVAILNVAAALAIALPQRIVFAPTLVAKPQKQRMRVAKEGRLVDVPTAPIDEALVWFETAVATAKEEAA